MIILYDSYKKYSTLYLRHWFCSDIEIVDVFDRPAICTIIGGGKSSSLVSMSNDGGL